MAFMDCCNLCSMMSCDCGPNDDCQKPKETPQIKNAVEYSVGIKLTKEQLKPDSASLWVEKQVTRYADSVFGYRDHFIKEILK